MAIEIGNSNVRATVIEMGMGGGNATLVIPFMWFTPATCDAWSPPVILIIKALQSRLRKLGYPNGGSGFVDEATSRALEQVVGRTWKNQPWITIYRAVLAHTGGTMSYGRSMGAVPPLTERAAGSRWGSLGNVPLSVRGYGTLGLAETAWCSDKNPQGNCKPLRGICKPMDVPTLQKIQELQRGLNKILASRKASLLDIDGRVGPKTTAAVNTVFPGQADCNAVMANLETLVSGVQGLASALPAVADPPSKPSNPPSLALPDGSVYNPPISQSGFSFTEVVEFVQTPLGLALVVGGVAAYLALRKPGKKKTTKRPRRRTTRRRRPKRTISYRYY